MMSFPIPPSHQRGRRLTMDFRDSHLEREPPSRFRIQVAYGPSPVSEVASVAVYLAHRRQPDLWYVPKLDAPSKPPLHTRFLPDLHPIRDRYFWLLYGLAPHGTVYIDSGAHRALADKAGLLPVGVVDVEGHFGQQEAVRIVVVKRKARGSSEFETHDPPPIEVGRAVVNYSATEIKRIRGVKSTEIHGVLGYADSEYVALRENIAFAKRESRPATPSRLTASQELEQRH